MKDTADLQNNIEQKLIQIEGAINQDPDKAYSELLVLTPDCGADGERLSCYRELLMGRCLQRRGKHKEAYDLISKNVSRLEELGAPRETSKGYHYLAQIHAAWNEPQMVLDCCLRGLEIAERENDWTSQMNLHVAYTPVYRAIGDSAKCLECYFRGKDIFLEHIKGKDPAAADTDDYVETIIDLNIAIQYHNMGDHEKALEYLLGMSDRVKKVLNGAYIDQYNTECANVCFALGKIKEGIEYSDAILSRITDNPKRFSLCVPANYINLCTRLLEADETERSLTLIGLVREQIETTNEPRIMGMFHMLLATHAKKVGDLEQEVKALELYADSVERQEKRRREENYSITARRIELQKNINQQKIVEEQRMREVVRLTSEMEHAAEREKMLGDISENTDTFYLLYSHGRGEIDFVSQNSLRLFGFDTEGREDICGDIMKWLGVDERDSLLFAKGQLTDRISRNYKTKNPITGDELTIHAEMLPSDYVRYILVLNDVTEIMNTQRSLISAIAEARKANQAKTSFMSNMSHDIRTPLNAIMGLLEMMEDKLDDTEQMNEYITMARQSSRHLLALINDVLDMSRIEAGRMTLSSEVFSLSAFISGVAGIIRPQTDSRSLTFRLDTDDVSDDMYISDTLRLRQVFLNVLGNSLKFTRSGGEISLTVKQSAAAREGFDRFEFIFGDTGCGMSPDFLKRLFTPFERAEDAVRSVEGTGLGMTITKSIVDLMGGTIAVSSELDKGTIFTITLELEHAAVGDAPEKDEKTTVHIKRQGTVLLVEDNEINRQIASHQLQKLGYTVEIAVDGQQALSMFEASAPGHYSVIFMDVRMPHMDGYEATRRIRLTPRRDAASVAIIAMTADAFDEDVKKALDSGMNAHLAKPLELSRLEQILTRLSSKE